MEDVNVDEVQSEVPKTYVDGKFETDADLEKGYTELNSMLGKQSEEVGQLRQKTAEYEQMLESQKSEYEKQLDAARNQSPPTDFEKLQTDLFKELESGNLTDAEYAKQSNALTAQQVQAQSQEQLNAAKAEMERKTTEILAERDRQEVVKKFYDENPGFKEAQESGALKGIMEANPLMGEVGAFYYLQAQNIQKQLEDAKLAAGSRKAGDVITDPGASMKKPRKPVVGEEAVKASMLEAAMAAAEQ